MSWQWRNIVIFSESGQDWHHFQPIINDLTGRLGRNVYFAQGFSGHGMALAGLAGKLMGEAVAGTAGGFDLFAKIPHHAFPGGRWLRTPALVLAMAYYRLRDLL